MTAIDFDVRRLSPRIGRFDWARSTRPGIRILDLPYANVRVRIAGRGDHTLVFACDMPNVVESYDEIVRLLGDRYRVVAWEQPGFGFSYPKPGFGFTLDHYVRAMIDMLDQLGLGPYTIVSSCQNVYQALRVADGRPDLVARLVLMQAVRWPDNIAWAGWAMNQFVLAGTFMPFVGKQIVRTPYLGQFLWAAMEGSIARRTHPHIIHRAKERPERFEQIAHPLYAAHKHGACTCFASAYQNYFESDLEIPMTTKPTVVVWANADFGHAGSDPKALLDYAPHASWIELSDTGHHLDLENPEAIAAILRDFAG